MGIELQEIALHGHRVAYRQAGEGPVVVLIHGITSTSETWERVMPYLARDFTVVAPDLQGHGDSAKPRGDYSLGAYASGIRDLLIALGHERATIVGHSLGGGVAMQLAYQFPERCERLVLVDSGGLGGEVSLVLRAATLPGASLALPFLAHERVIAVGSRIGRGLGRLGLRIGTDMAQMAKGHATLNDEEARQAFLSTLRTVIDFEGQRVDARDRLYLAENVPFLIVWGERDSIIPVEHGRATHEMVPASRLEVFPQAGHFPQLDDPQRFVDVISQFIASTEPADIRPEELRELLRGTETQPG